MGLDDLEGAPGRDHELVADVRLGHGAGVLEDERGLADGDDVPRCGGEGAQGQGGVVPGPGAGEVVEDPARVEVVLGRAGDVWEDVLVELRSQGAADEDVLVAHLMLSESSAASSDASKLHWIMTGKLAFAFFHVMR